MKRQITPEEKKKPKVKELLDDIGDYESLLALKSTDGGKILLKNIKKDSEALLNEITRTYKKISHIELISLIADFNSNLNLLRIFSRVRKNKGMAEEFLEEVLKEE